MAILTADEAIEILRQPRDKSLEQAEYHEERINMHSQPTDREPIDNKAYSHWKYTQIKDRLDDTKFEKYFNVQEYPLATVDFIEAVNNEIEKVFDAQDAFKEVKLKSQTFTDEAQECLKKSNVFMRNEGFHTMKFAINSIQITDLPKEQEGLRPEPYTYFLDVCKVICIGLKNALDPAEYVGFYTGHKNGERPIVAFIDSGSYRLFEEYDSTRYVLIEGSEAPHDLGFTPARPFWTTKYNKKKDLVRAKSPISNSLGRLDNLLWKEGSKEHADLYLLYPPFWSYPEDTRYDEESPGDDPNNHSNVDPYFRTGTSNYLWYGSYYAGGVDQAIRRSNKKYAGAGVHLESPLPTADGPNIDKPGGYLEPNVKNVEFISQDLANTKENIWHYILGHGYEPKNDQAKNEKQIQAGFESREAVFKNIKKNFELAQDFQLTCELGLKYGIDQVQDVTINYGNQFTMQTSDSLKESYKLSLDNGLPDSYLAEERQQIINSKYRNNPAVKSKLDILRKVNPTSFSQAKALEMIGSGKVDDNLLKVTIYLNELADEFELENGPIESFAEDMPMTSRVFLIRQAFNGYLENGTIYGGYRGTEEGIS